MWDYASFLSDTRRYFVFKKLKNVNHTFLSPFLGVSGRNSGLVLAVSVFRRRWLSPSSDNFEIGGL